MWESVKKIVGAVAPFLGTMLGGPMGGMAATAIKKVLLGDENATDEALENSLLNASPSALVKIKQLNTTFKREMALIGLSEHKVAALDRDSAREREVKIQDSIPAILSILLTVGFFVAFGATLFVPLPEANRSIIDIMIGSLGTAWVSAITYYFGSSHGSQIKTMLLGKKE